MLKSASMFKPRRTPPPHPVLKSCSFVTHFLRDLVVLNYLYEVLSDCKTRYCNRDIVQLAIHSNSILQMITTD